MTQADTQPLYETRTISIEDALILAKAQRPGRRIIMGPMAALDAPTQAVIAHKGAARSPRYEDLFPGHDATTCCLALLLAEIRREPLTEAHLAPFLDPDQTRDEAKAVLREARDARDAA